jgi:hypothetical protein
MLQSGEYVLHGDREQGQRTGACNVLARAGGLPIEAEPECQRAYRD